MNTIDRKNALLSHLASKELTMERFLLGCALWSLETECMVDYEVREYPLPPQEYTEYLELPFEKRIKIPQEFFHQSIIKDYIISKSGVYSQNWAEYKWLLDCKRLIPDTEEYLEQHLRLDKKIFEYKVWFNACPQFLKLKEVFEGTEV